MRSFAARQPAPPWLVVLVLIITAIVPPPPAVAEALDQPLPDGHFYGQAVGQAGRRGFAVRNADGVRFWDELQRAGGVEALGYPISRRFRFDGFEVQVFQKGALQWRPEAGQASLLNLFDELHQAGKDDWLAAERSTPRLLGSAFDGGRDRDGVVAARLALLDESAAIKALYFSVEDPLAFFGLPQSAVTDLPDRRAVRFQRAVIEEWQQDAGPIKAGQVTVANGGEYARDAGLFPAAAFEPEWAPGAEPTAAAATPAPTVSPTPAATPVAVASPAPAPTQAATPPGPSNDPAQAALDRLNYYRALSGLPPVALDPVLQRMAEGHVAYYVQHSGDPSHAGVGIHNQQRGRPGFTGESIGARADAAGWGGYAADENAGLVGDPRLLVDAFMDTVNHRWNMLHPSAVAIGYAMAREPKVDIMNIGVAAATPAVALPAVYPGPDQPNVPLLSYIWESPDPAAGMERPTGYPITVLFHVTSRVEWGDVRLTDAAGNPVAYQLYQKDWLKGLAIIPHKPLKENERYTVRVSGMVDGATFEKTWAFTTGAK